MYLIDRWAVSSVMTRQNQVPAESGRQVLALVPLWDMCNHTEGEVDAPNNFIHSSKERNSNIVTCVLIFCSSQPTSMTNLNASSASLCEISTKAIK